MSTAHTPPLPPTAVAAAAAVCSTEYMEQSLTAEVRSNADGRRIDTQMARDEIKDKGEEDVAFPPRGWYRLGRSGEAPVQQSSLARQRSWFLDTSRKNKSMHGTPYFSNLTAAARAHEGLSLAW